MNRLIRVFAAAMGLVASVAQAQFLQPSQLLLGTNRVDVIYEATSANRATALLQDRSGVRGRLTLLLAEGYSEGVASWDGQRYALTLTEQETRITELPTPPPGGPGDTLQAPNDLPAPRRLKDTGPRIATAANPVVVDVMLLYTPAAKSRKGGAAGIQNTINLALAEANQAYVDSGVYVVLNPVYVGELNFAESTSMSSDLGRLAGLTEVANLRAQYKADLVNLMIDSSDMWAGIAYVLTGTSDWGYSLVQAKYGYGYFVFAHELGHNFGAMHDRQNSSFAPATPYGYGYRFNASGQTYHTIMAYDPGIRIGFFSTPLRTFLGVPLGVADSEDVARLLNERASLVAAFRDAPGYTVQVIKNGTGSIFYNGTEVSSNLVVSRGAVVQLSVTSGTFLVWSGAMVTTNRGLSFVANSNLTLVAHFADGSQPLAPQITRQPKSLNVRLDGTIVLSAEGWGIPAPSFRWKKDGADFGVSGRVLTLEHATESDNGAYQCVVSNASGVVPSQMAVVTVGHTPVFVQQPVSQFGQLGGNAIFSALLNTPEDVWYQWYYNETPLPLATNEMLILFNLTGENMGAYHVEADTPLYHVRSETAQLLLATPPAITQQPQRVEVTKGATATFNVQAAGLPPIYYQWRFNGNDLPGQTNDTLVLSSVQTNQAGSYAVQVSNPQGITTSTNATLVVYNPLVILKQPVDLTAARGDTPIFGVSAEGSPPITYQWFRDGLALTNQVYGTCRLRNVQTTNAGIYWVEIKNPAGTILSEQVLLTVIQPPVITQGPQNVTGDQGGSITFTVVAEGLAPLSYQWFKGSDSLPQATEPSFTLRNLTVADTGWYSVRITNPDGQTNSSAALLQIVTPPAIVQPPADSTVVNGGTAFFAVTATGATPLSYQWYFNGAILSGAVNETLSLARIQPSQAGSYSVVVSNRLGQAQSQAARLTVLDPPVVTLADALTADEGTNLVIAPVVAGRSPMTYTWKKGATAFGSGTDSPQLSLPGLKETDQGVYTFTAQNSDGQASRSLNLAVNLAPRITQQPAAAAAEAGSSATLTVGVRGTAPFTYFWFRDTNLVFVTSAGTFTLTNLSWELEGSYQVLVSNRLGTVLSSNALLTILQPPHFTQQPQSQTVVAGQTASLSAAATGRPPLTNAWYKNNSLLGSSQPQLVFNPVTTADAGVYCVKISNRDGTLFSANANLVVVSPPVLTAQPASQTVNKGATVSFSVQVSSSSPVTYLWFKDDVALLSATDAQLTLANCQPGNAGAFSVRVSNAAGSVTSARAVLVVKDPPVLTQQPLPVTATYGQTVSFNVAATGKTPLVYRWFKNGQAISGANVAMHPLPAVTRADLGGYSVQVTNSDGSVLSQVATLTYASDPPVLVSQPTNVSVTPAQTLTLRLTVLGHEPMTNSWYRNGQLLTTTTNPVLALTNAHEGHAGTYLAVLANDDGVATSAPIEVRVAFDPPSITRHPSSLLVGLGRRAVLSVTCANSGGLSYQWFKNQVALTGETNYYLEFPSVHASDVAAFMVRITNDSGEAVSQTVTLQILNPPTITLQPADATVNRLANTSFTGAATSSVPVTYQWWAGSAALPNQTNPVLSLTSVQTNQAGGYALSAANEGGVTVSRFAWLTVLDPPVITLQPQGATVAVGATTSLSVEAEGRPPLLYRWYLNNSPLATATQSTLTLPSAQASQGGTYFVTVSNEHGRASSSSVTLSVQAPPAFTTQPRNTTVNLGSSTSLDAMASGYGSLSYQWYRDDQLIPNATSPTYAIANATAAHEGTYTIRARNLVGEALSQAAFLKVKQPPVITSPPVAAIFQIGASSTLSVAATGRAPLAYQWEKVRVPIPGATGPTLTLANLTSADDALYRVTIANLDGSVTSSEVRLQLDPSQISPPGITRQPVDTKALKGSATNLWAEVSGTPPLSFQWRKAGLLLAGATNKTLSFPNVQDAQLGLYDLVATNLYGRATSSAARLDYAALPGITVPPVPTDLVEGNTLRLSVTATNATSYQWFRAGILVADQTTPELVLPNAVTAYTGSYTVRVLNPWGSVSSAAVMAYVRTKPLITSQPLSQSVNRRATLSLGVTATGDGPLAYQWFREGATLAGATASTLVTTNIQLTQAGAYTVLVTSPYGAATSQVAQVTVKDPPIILVPPMGTTVRQGDPFTLSITLGGLTPFTYRWLLNGNTVGGSTSNLTVAHATAADAGDYYVQISNPDGSGYSPIAHVNVRLAPAVLTACQTFTVNKGASLALPVLATGEAPITWQWLFNGTNLPGATGTNLALANLQPTQTGTYGVWLSNAIGTVTANIAVVVVKDPPVITVQPVGALVLPGQSVSFGVTAIGGIPLSYQWKQNGVPLTNLTATASLLTLSSVTPADAGAYSVLVMNVDGAVESTNALLAVGQAPIITTQPTDQRVAYGATATLVAAATGTAPLTYQWTKNGIALPNATSPILVLANVTPDAEAGYALQAANPLGQTTSRVASVTVIYPPTIRAQPQSLTANQGANVALEVLASGREPITYTWKRNGAPILGPNSRVLSFNNVQPSSAGTYTVSLANTDGTADSTAAILTIRPLPVITRQPDVTIVTVSNDLRLSVQATAAEPLTYRWFKDGRALPAFTQPDLLITNAAYSDAGLYTVAITSVVGTVVSEPAIVLILPTQPIKIPANQIQPVMLAVVPLTDGTVGLLYHGAVGRTYELQATTNLTTWQALGTFTLLKNVNQFIDKDSPQHRSRLYRVRLVR